jgi:3-oxoadipate enol-lactonase
MPKVKVGDINIYYEVHGKGEPLVLIPGGYSNLKGYFRHFPVFAREYQVIAYDPRGAGQSDAPDIPYTLEMMTDDLAGLMDAISIESAHILGPSLGGAIAQVFALRYPDRVRSLILACTSAQKVNITDPEIIESYQHPEALTPKERIIQSLHFNMSREFIDNNPELVKRIIKNVMKHPMSPQGAMRQGQMSGGDDIFERLPEIKVPTLVIHGDVDRFIPVENGRILASRIPGAELAILKKMGHGFMTEAFDESNRIMLDFLRRHRAKKA